MNLNIKIVSVCFIFLLVLSCENGVNSSKVNNLDTLFSTTHFLWPSKVGSYWDYNQYSFSPDYEIYNLDSTWTYEGFISFGINLDTVQKEPSLYRKEIVDSIFINIDDTIYSCHIFSGYDPIKKKYYDLKFPYWIGNDGIYDMGIYENEGDSLFKKGLCIPSEISVNNNWGGQVSYRLDGHLLSTSSVVERKCLSKNEVINTPLGDFECYVIFTRMWKSFDASGYYDYYDYYSPEIGNVCTIRLAVTPIYGPDYYGEWWLEYISVINNCSIK